MMHFEFPTRFRALDDVSIIDTCPSLNRAMRIHCSNPIRIVSLCSWFCGKAKTNDFVFFLFMEDEF